MRTKYLHVNDDDESTCSYPTPTNVHYQIQQIIQFNYCLGVTIFCSMMDEKEDDIEDDSDTIELYILCVDEYI